MTEDTEGNETVFRFPMILSQTDNDKTKQASLLLRKELESINKYFAFCICLSLVAVPFRGHPALKALSYFIPPLASDGLGYWM